MMAGKIAKIMIVSVGLLLLGVALALVSCNKDGGDNPSSPQVNGGAANFYAEEGASCDKPYGAYYHDGDGEFALKICEPGDYQIEYQADNGVTYYLWVRVNKSTVLHLGLYSSGQDVVKLVKACVRQGVISLEDSAMNVSGPVRYYPKGGTAIPDAPAIFASDGSEAVCPIGDGVVNVGSQIDELPAPQTGGGSSGGNGGATTYTVTTTKSGTGTGSVTGGGTYAAGAAVSLTATATGTSTFAGWTSGPCSGAATNPCNFAMPASNVTANAQFDPAAPGTYVVTVTFTGTDPNWCRATATVNCNASAGACTPLTQTGTGQGGGNVTFNVPSGATATLIATDGCNPVVTGSPVSEGSPAATVTDNCGTGGVTVAGSTACWYYGAPDESCVVPNTCGDITNVHPDTGGWAIAEGGTNYANCDTLLTALGQDPDTGDAYNDTSARFGCAYWTGGPYRRVYTYTPTDYTVSAGVVYRVCGCYN